MPRSRRNTGPGIEHLVENFNQQFVADVHEKLKDLKASDDVEYIAFPTTLTAAERKYVHQAAKQLGLFSRSCGEGLERSLQVHKEVAALPPPDEKTQENNVAARRESVSRTLSSVLRHRAVNLGLSMRSDGYAKLQDLLVLPVVQRLMPPPTVPEVQETVHTCEKQRFSMKEEDGELWIRANQGHTVATVDDKQLLRAIKNPQELATCVHGTYLLWWEAIRKEGLRAMGRNHIHFVPKQPGEEVISGMRTDAQIAIYIDAAAAMADGCEFLASANDVVLTRGFDGRLPVRYFRKAVLIVKAGDQEAGTQIYPEDVPVPAHSSTLRAPPEAAAAPPVARSEAAAWLDGGPSTTTAQPTAVSSDEEIVLVAAVLAH
eukprot:TRINITY_DN122613_c0_g1_i1.p1 TRINITY_DN122613_c0_g1~~TRINITY_DN122613_c0_g1_i1.p1  ORF type:complete len:374 (+),score=81.88 TRINITY_DN122613_c0_g1_i1:56-1177(+)